MSYKELYGWTMDEIVKEIGRKNNCASPGATCLCVVLPAVVMLIDNGRNGCSVC